MLNGKCNLRNSNTKPVTVMVEHFVHSLSNANDTGVFDTSLEIKAINCLKEEKYKNFTKQNCDDLKNVVTKIEEKANFPQNFIAYSHNEKHQHQQKSPIIEKSFSQSSSSIEITLTSPSSVLLNKTRNTLKDPNTVHLESLSTDFNFELIDKNFPEECQNSRIIGDNNSQIKRNILNTFEFYPSNFPMFKLTAPPKVSSSTFEFGKIFQRPFCARRASIATLKKLANNPDKNDIETADYKEIKNEFVEAKTLNKSDSTAVIRNLNIVYSRPLSSTSPLFRRWGHSSFRSSKQTHSRIPLLRKLSPLAASEINVYSKTMDEFVNDLNSQCIHDTSLSGGDTDSHNQNSSEFNKENDNQSSAVINWSTSFEKLLEDSSGLYTFAEFLKKEFSAENIYFWTACERYRQIDSDEVRATLALEIYSKHLASKASEPVNVDSQARNITEESLKTADKNLFMQAQKQIFNLMKFDSYQRFIRSDLYKKCLEAESKNQPLPYPGNQLDELLKTKLNSPGPSKLKKSTSNAEDRRRKSLLPWHRKTRCKSRDRNEYGGTSSSNKSSEKFSENSLKLPIKNSVNDIHSSRSSLSSFDATVAASGYCGSDDLKSCSLCRVLICDGVTTIVQIRSDETIKQLIDRLLEKRGIHYQYFDVILSDQLKSIDVENSASYLAGKEVQIEQRVAFKLHLPDPKVISVKSKPKKVLYEVLKPILYKYNYHLDNVQVLIKDTHEKLNVSVPVTEIDGQRLQIVLSKSEDCKRDLSQAQKQSKINHESLIQSPLYKNQLNSKTVLSTSSKSVKPVTQQITLDEITNKVFNELLQGKVESHSNQISLPKVFDHSSIKSDDCISESSSLFERFCYRDSNILTEGLKGLKPRKLNVGILPSTSKNLTRSQDGLSISTQATNENDAITNYMKKPLIAKWKTGVKLQVPGKTENHDEFLEGLKRAQRARLEDQRGTEINSELPDFLKDKRKSNASNKLDKIWYNLNPIERLNTPKIPLTIPSSSSIGLSITDIKNNFENRLGEKPQPAPRLSITKDNHSSIVNNNVISPPSVKIEIQELNCLDDDQHCESNVEQNNYSCNSNDDGGGILNNNDINDVTCNNNNNEFEIDLLSKEPPPLPPKPKVLPIKPSNWGHGLNSGNNNLTASSPSDISRRHANKIIEKKSIDRNVYLDQPSSSFV